MVDLSHAIRGVNDGRCVPVALHSIGYPSAEDVIERAAFLEFCEGLDRASADRQALAEFGFSSFDELKPFGSQKGDPQDAHEH